MTGDLSLLDDSVTEKDEVIPVRYLPSDESSPDLFICQRADDVSKKQLAQLTAEIAASAGEQVLYNPGLTFRRGFSYGVLLVMILVMVISRMKSGTFQPVTVPSNKK